MSARRRCSWTNAPYATAESARSAARQSTGRASRQPRRRRSPTVGVLQLHPRDARRPRRSARDFSCSTGSHAPTRAGRATPRPSAALGSRGRRGATACPRSLRPRNAAAVRANSPTMNARSNAALYAAGTHPWSAAATSCAMASKRGESFTSSSLIPWIARCTSAGMGDAGVEQASCTAAVTAPCCATTMPISTTRSTGRVTPGGLDVEQRDRQIVPRGLVRELFDQPAHHRAKEVRDAGVEPPRREAAARRRARSPSLLLVPPRRHGREPTVPRRRARRSRLPLGRRVARPRRLELEPRLAIQSSRSCRVSYSRPLMKIVGVPCDPHASRRASCRGRCDRSSLAMPCRRAASRRRAPSPWRSRRRRPAPGGRGWRTACRASPRTSPAYRPRWRRAPPDSPCGCAGEQGKYL